MVFSGMERDTLAVLRQDEWRKANDMLPGGDCHCCTTHRDWGTLGGAVAGLWRASALRRNPADDPMDPA